MGLPFNVLMVTAIFIAVSNIIPLTYATSANVSVDYAKVGACNSTITVRVGDYCDYVVTIIIPMTNSTNTSTDLSVEIIMPDNATVVMQMSKPSVTYVGTNFYNWQSIYSPTYTMTSQLNTSQYNDAVLDFGTVVNNGAVSASNDTLNSIIIGFRSVVISVPGYETNGSQYWVTVGIEYNNVSEIWIGQALFIFLNTTAGTQGPFNIGTVNNSSLQIPQGSPFALNIPINYAYTYASNFVFTITNNNPSQLGLCSAYVENATAGFQHLPTLGYEISQKLTTALTNNQISISLGQIVNTQYSSGNSTLYIVVYGRIFKTDSNSSYTAGTMTAQVTATSSNVTQAFTLYAIPAIIPTTVTGSLPTISLTQQSGTVGIYQSLSMTITMAIPSGFSAPVVFDLNGSSNMSTPVMKSCAVIFQSAGENVGSSNPQCADQNILRRTYVSSDNSTNYDQLTYDYGVISNLGSRPTTYAATVNTIVVTAIFQVLNTSKTVVWPTASMTIGNNTIWIGNVAANVTTMSYNTTNATQPSFQLSYENGTTNSTSTILGASRLFYYDIFTQPSGVYTPMTVKITSNETYTGSGIPAVSICLVQVLSVGQNLPCVIPTLYNQPQSPFITYSSRYNQRKNDTVNIQFGPLCNYQSNQTTSSLGQIRLGIYIKLEQALGNATSTYVNVDVYYTPNNLWVGQIMYTGIQPSTPPTVVGTPLLFPMNTTTQSFNRNALTIANYGLKIPEGSFGSYTGLTSTISLDSSQQTSVCRVDISPNRGIHVPCSDDVSSVFTYNTNGFPSTAVTNLGLICSIATNSSGVNSTQSFDSDTLIVQVYILANLQTSSSFALNLSGLQPSSGSVLSSFTSGSTYGFGNVSSLLPLNVSNFQQLNDTNNGTLVYLGQDVLIRTQFVLANNLTSQSCYSLSFQFGITPGSSDAAYFTTAFYISAGDNLMCMKSKATAVLSSGGSPHYNASMSLDLGIVCYYPIDPTNTSANTMIIQTNARVPVSTSAAVNSQIAVNIVALINNNQSSLNVSYPLTIQNYTSYKGFTLYSNDTTNVSSSTVNSTIVSGIRQVFTTGFKIYLPTFSEGRLQISLASVPVNNSVSVDIISATIVSAGINVGSFMFEYALGTKYQWSYSSSVNGSSYQDTAFLDLGVVTNTGTTALQNSFSSATDNYIYVQATGYLTDSPAAQQNYSFTIRTTALYGGNNVSTTNSVIVARNGTECPAMFVNHTDLTNGTYVTGSTYTGLIQYGHEANSTAECINAQLIIYLPTWMSFQSYNSSNSMTSFSTDNSSYVLFNVGTLLFNDVGSLKITLYIGSSNQMSLVYQRYNSPIITIPYEFLCTKRPRTVNSYPTNKVFAFGDVISLSTSMTIVSTHPSLLDSLDPCQFTSSVAGSTASDVRTTGWSTGYRSNQWMLTASTYLQINFGNLTTVNTIQLTVPSAFAPILTLQLGYSWDGTAFALDPTKYFANGSSSYAFPLPKPLLLQSLRIYLIDVVQPSDLSNKTSGFILNVTGTTNSTTATVANTCPSVVNALSPRTILVAPSAQSGLTYYGDVYLCDETTTRTMTLCYVLYNGAVPSSATWSALNTTVANINQFVYDAVQEIQSLYGYAQDGQSVVRSDDRGLTWSVVDLLEYNNVTAQCSAGTKVCTTSDSYPLTSAPPGFTSLQGGNVAWVASVNGLWTQQSGGVLAFDWFGY